MVAGEQGVGRTEVDRAGLVQPGHLVRGEVDLANPRVLLPLPDGPGSEDRRGGAGVPHGPGESDLSRGGVQFGGDLLVHVHDGQAASGRAAENHAAVLADASTLSRRPVGRAVQRAVSAPRPCEAPFAVLGGSEDPGSSRAEGTECGYAGVRREDCTQVAGRDGPTTPQTLPGHSRARGGAVDPEGRAVHERSRVGSETRGRQAGRCGQPGQQLLDCSARSTWRRRTRCSCGRGPVTASLQWCTLPPRSIGLAEAPVSPGAGGCCGVVEPSLSAALDGPRIGTHSRGRCQPPRPQLAAHGCWAGVGVPVSARGTRARARGSEVACNLAPPSTTGSPCALGPSGPPCSP